MSGATGLSPGLSPGSSGEPAWITRGALLCAALLPWFGLLSGLYGLYSYILLGALVLGDALSMPDVFFLGALLLAAPLGVLLLFIMPAGLVCAALRRPPRGRWGLITRAGCLVSMVFAALCAGLISVISVLQAATEGAVGPWSLFLLWRVAVLVFGIAATWFSWRWLCIDARKTGARS